MRNVLGSLSGISLFPMSTPLALRSSKVFL
jgi:hypothetical protein